MAFLKLAILLTAAAVVTGQSKYSPKKYEEEPQETLSQILQVPEYVTGNRNNAPQLALSLQLPREDAPQPFDSYAYPRDDLRAPEGYEIPSGNFYDVPIPSQDLQVPTIGQWNPENDPNLYYELPVEITKTIVPTNVHPKKYNQLVFGKTKPISSKPKEEVVLVPIKLDALLKKQKQQDKAEINYAKVQNQKNLQAEKVRNREQETAASGFDTPLQSFHSVHPHHESSSSGERVEFHMHGHDGPKSYKWGYDTGKGHNRQFRYEESNNDGFVKGHYGYFDKVGKLQMVQYEADPLEGFHAEGNIGNS